MKFFTATTTTLNPVPALGEIAFGCSKEVADK